MSVFEELAARAGTWRGSNTLQDPNTGKPEESPSTATLTAILGGRFIRVDYTWAYQGAPQEGSLLVGFDPHSGQASGYWVDTWHMGRKALVCLGASNSDGVIALRGTYPAPPGPDWGWRIEIAANDHSLRITHTNIDAEGTADLAVEGVYSPAGESLVTPSGVFFREVGPIGDTDTDALPVKEIVPAVGYYTQCLGFSLVSKDRTTASLKRDNVRIGLAVNGRNPEQASCWFSVGNVDALRREFEAKGVGPGIIDGQEYDGKPYRVFFAKDPYGVCFCFTQPLEENARDGT